MRGDHLLMHLTDQHVPEEVLNQAAPWRLVSTALSVNEDLIVKSSALLQLLRPLLNRRLSHLV